MLEGVDLEKVIEGSTFDVVWLERRFGVSILFSEYSKQCMQFAAQLERELWRQDRKLTVRIEGGSVCVLTQAEALRHNAQHYDNYLDRARNRHRHMKAIDTSQLSYEEQEAHRFLVGRQAIELNAVRRLRNLASKNKAAV